MSGTKAGGKKMKETIIEKYGKDYYKEIGRKGGKVCCKKGFSMDPNKAVLAGMKGGRISRRRSKNETKE